MNKVKLSQEQLEIVINTPITTLAFDSLVSDPLNIHSILIKDEAGYLQSICGIEPFQNLTQLELIDSSELQDLDSLGQLHRLENLSVVNCGHMIEYQFLSELTELESLAIDGASRLYSLEHIEACKQLTHLSLPNCYKLLTLSGIESLENLESLNLFCCHSLSEISGLNAHTLPKLAFLDITGCKNICGSQHGYIPNLLAAKPHLRVRGANEYFLRIRQRGGLPSYPEDLQSEFDSDMLDSLNEGIEDLMVFYPLK